MPFLNWLLESPRVYTRLIMWESISGSLLCPIQRNTQRFTLCMVERNSNKLQHSKLDTWAFTLSKYHIFSPVQWRLHQVSFWLQDVYYLAETWWTGCWVNWLFLSQGASIAWFIVVLPIASYNRWVLTVILSWLQYVYFLAETWSTGCCGEASVCTMSVATFSLTGQSLTCGRVWPTRLSYIGHKQSSSLYHRGYNWRFR